MAEWYDGYLKSDHWQLTRIKRLLQAKLDNTWNVIQCERAECGLWVPLPVIEVHHKTYERVGCELMEDLEVLCASCHGVRHGRYPAQWWLRAKSSGRMMVTTKSTALDRNLHHIGDVVLECLAYCDIRLVSTPFAEQFK